MINVELVSALTVCVYAVSCACEKAHLKFLDFHHSVCLCAVRNLVHHFHDAFNVMEVTELVSVGRTKAQEWCLSHGHKWRDVHAGVDFFGSPFSYRYLEPKDCCLYQALA